MTIKTGVVDSEALFLISSNNNTKQEVFEMTEKNELDKGAFLSMAKAFGLDTNDPHIEDLYGYVKKILPSLKPIEELNLEDIEPVFPLVSPSGEKVFQ